MHYSFALAAVAAVANTVNAHGAPARPQIMGLNPRDLKARDLLSGIGVRFAGANEFVKSSKGQLKARDSACGPGVGSCSAGDCCSPEGFCGTGIDYCYSPGCQYQYGPGCPENQTPAGTNTSSVARPKLGSVEYGGAGIYNCVNAGDVAITYDDGPLQDFTSHILDVLASHGAKATFFITGNNIGKGAIDITPELTADILRMDAAGHQIASHTWTHLDLDAVSSLDRKNQMWKNEMAFRNILGKFPTYMRPPYSSCTSSSAGGGSCEADLATLGYHVTYFNLDTDDYEHDDPSLIQTSKDWYYGNMTAAGAAPASSSFLVIGHDIHQQTAYNLTDYMLTTLTSLGYKSVTVGECLGDDSANWYRSASGAASATSTTSTATRSSSVPASTATVVTTDATCGGTNQYTCLGSTFGNCCSVNGWCGSTSDYCGTGCQSSFGTCGVSSSSSVITSSSSAVSSSSVRSSSSSIRASSTPIVSSSSTRSSSSTSVRVSSTPVSSSSAGASSSSSARVSSSSSARVSSSSSVGASSSSSVRASSTLASSSSARASSTPVSSSSARTSSTPASSASVRASSTPASSASIRASSTPIVSSSRSASSITATSTRTSSTTHLASTSGKAATTYCTDQPAASPTKSSTDGRCAGNSGHYCQGSRYGDCCSPDGWCGREQWHCGNGCQGWFGFCL